MNVLFVASEFADFVKAGGLGDVSACLPRALRRRAIDISVLMPAYPEVIERAAAVSIVADLPARSGVKPCRIGKLRTPDSLIVYLVFAPSLSATSV